MVNVLFNLILSPFREQKRHWITSVDFKVQRKGLKLSWYCCHTDQYCVQLESGMRSVS